MKRVISGWLPSLRISDLWKAYKNADIRSEERYREFLRTFFKKKFVILFPMARFALYAVCKALLPPRSEVLLPAFNVPVVIAFLRSTGMRLKYVDASPGTCNVDADMIIRAITPRTRAIIVAHLHGRSVDLARLHALCSKRKILLIEDAAQSFGSLLQSKDPRIAGKLCGTVGDIGVFSTGVMKMFSTLIGGFIVTDNERYYEEISEYIRKHTRKNAGAWYMRSYVVCNTLLLLVTRLPFVNVVFIYMYRHVLIRMLLSQQKKVVHEDSIDYSFFIKGQSVIGNYVSTSCMRLIRTFSKKACTLHRNLFPDAGRVQEHYRFLRYPILVRERAGALRRFHRAGYYVEKGVFANFGGDACVHAQYAFGHNLELPLHERINNVDLRRISVIVRTEIA